MGFHIRTFIVEFKTIMLNFDIVTGNVKGFPGVDIAVKTFVIDDPLPGLVWVVMLFPSGP